MPTAGGWKLLVLGVIAVAGGRAFGILELYVISATAVAAVVLAMLARLVHPSRLSIGRRVSSAMVAVSEPVEVRLEILNQAGLSSPAVRIREQINGVAGTPTTLAPLAGGAGAEGIYRLHPARRGVLEIGPTLVEDVDGLELARRRQVVGQRARVIVHPMIESLAPPSLPAGGDMSVPIEFRRRLLGLETEEFDILRPYAEGDDLRHIHWRSTARLDQLVVRRFQPSRQGRLTIVIDTRPPGDMETVLDATTSVAASIVCAVLASGDGARILTTDGRGTPLLTHRSDVAGALEFLALLEDGQPSIDVEALDGGAAGVVVTARPEAIDDADTRIGLAQRLNASLIITHSAGGLSSARPAADAPGGWIHLTGPGQLPDLWRLAALAGRGTSAALA